MKHRSLVFFGILLLFAGISCNNIKLGSDDEILIPVLGSGAYLYVDKENNIKINPSYSYATAFRDNVALVKDKDENTSLWGYIDITGNYIVKPQFKGATVFSDGMAWALKDNGAPILIDNSGNTIKEFKEIEKARLFTEGLAAFQEKTQNGYQWGYLEKSGAVIIPPGFRKATPFSEGLAAVQNEKGDWGYIDNKGKLVINFQFANARPFRSNQAVVQFDRYYGTINKSGKYVIKPQFDDMLSDGSNFLVKQGPYYGWCNEDGKYIINPRYDDGRPFSEGDLAPVKSREKWGYIDNEGEYVINLQFEEAYPFINNDLAVVKSSGRYGFINKSGAFELPPQYEGISKDYLQQVTYKSSLYSAIESQYVDFATLLDKIDVNSQSFLSKNYAELVEYLSNTSQDSISFSEDEIQWVKKKEAVDHSFSYSFYFLGSAYTKTVERQLVDRVYVGRGEYKNKYRERETYSLEPDKNSPKAWIFEVEMSGKAKNMGNNLAEIISERLSGYNLLPGSNSQKKKTFQDEVSKLTIEVDGNSNANDIVKIHVEPLLSTSDEDI